MSFIGERAQFLLISLYLCLSILASGDKTRSSTASNRLETNIKYKTSGIIFES